MTRPSPQQQSLRERLTALHRYRVDRLDGDEKGEAQIFLERMMQAFGHEGIREAGATLEYRVKRNDQRGTAFADLMWKPRCLIEMKRAGQDLGRHYRQAFDYWMHAVPNRPRWVILCNFDEFWIYDFDSQLDEPMDRVALEQLPARHEALSFLLPIEEEPLFQNNLVQVTRAAAGAMATIFRSMAERGVDRSQAQKFVLQCVMAMFSEDIGLLPGPYFSLALRDAVSGRDCYDLLGSLFREMNTPGLTPGGRFSGTDYFNGGLFADPLPQELTNSELALLNQASATDWSRVRPEIFGTLFEGSLDADARHAQGAHFTSQADIVRIVGPVIVEPFRDQIESARDIRDLERVRLAMANFRVLDPACGSGNFLYVAYREMRRLEQLLDERIAERRRSTDIALQSGLSFISSDHFLGLDSNPFAVEIAKVTMMLAKKLASDELGEQQQVLPLDNLDNSIVATDSLFSPWPTADAIIGNPPYLGRRKMQRELGATYTSRLAQRHPKVGGVSDYVTYWFPLAHDHLPPGGRAGFVATDSIRENASRSVSLDYIVRNGGTIFDAVSSQPWSGDANVNVSIVNWVKGDFVGDRRLWLDGTDLLLRTPQINSSLSPEVDVSGAVKIAVNRSPKSCFQGITPGVVEAFVVDDATHDAFEAVGEGGALHRYSGGSTLLSEHPITEWLIDLPHEELLDAESQYPRVMAHLRIHALPPRVEAARAEAEANAQALTANPGTRGRNHHERFLDRWWQLGYRRPDLLDETERLTRYIAVPRYQTEARRTIALFVDSTVRVSDQTNVFPFDDEYTLGVISSSAHRAWLVRRCSTLSVALRYTTTTVWETFPWPQSPNQGQVARVAEAMAQVLEERERSLQQGHSLASMYDALRSPGRSALRSAHDSLDTAVLDAFGFDGSQDVVTQLLALNQLVGAATGGAGPGSYSSGRLTGYKLV